jgi:hypothetical protein
MLTGHAFECLYPSLRQRILHALTNDGLIIKLAAIIGRICLIQPYALVGNLGCR